MEPLNPEVVQAKMLELLTFVDGVCRANNISYWVDGGTLLGAVRHQGFIPWDDDLDICLMKPDYDRLLHILSEQAGPDNYWLYYLGQERMSFWSEYFGSIDLLIENAKGHIVPCKIDISPMKAIEKTDEAADRAITGVANYLNSARVNPHVTEKYRRIPVDKDEALRQKTIFFDDYNRFYMNAKGVAEAGCLINYSYGDSYAKAKRDYFDYSDIFPLGQIYFENVRVFCPGNVDAYLTKLYGSRYMEPVGAKHQKPAHHRMILNDGNRLRYSRAELSGALMQAYEHSYRIGTTRYKFRLFFSRAKVFGFWGAVHQVIGYVRSRSHARQNHV